jgi:hypothetical protein
VETFVFIVATITVTLLWKLPKLTVMQQAPSRYYGNATRCTDHVTTENLICHNIKTVSHLSTILNKLFLFKEMKSTDEQK